MKRAILCSVIALAASSSFAATTVCNNAATGADVAVTKASPVLFILNNFTMKCSAKVFLDYNESGTGVSVSAASSGGKNYFTGSTAGGAVAPSGTQCSGACTSAGTVPAAPS